LQSAAAEATTGHTLSRNEGGKFKCGQLRAVSSTEFSSAVENIHQSNVKQAADYKAAQQAAREKAALQAQQDQAAADQRDANNRAAFEAQQGQRDRDEAARRAAIDEDRAANGLSPLIRSDDGANLDSNSER
jgi:hypothetical protein